jgi:hypothetical protein
MATEKILIFDEAGNAKRMKVRIARFLDNEPVTAADKTNIRTTLDVDDSLSGTFTTPLSVTSTTGTATTQALTVADGSNTNFIVQEDGKVGIGGNPSTTNPLRVSSSDATTPQALIQSNSSTGDAALSFNVSGRTYTLGVDKSDFEKFKISRSSELGNTDYVTIDGGNVTVTGGRLEAKPTSGTNTGSQGELRLYGHESNASRFAAIKCYNTGGTDQNALSFYTSSGGTETQRVRIDEVAGDVEVLTGNVVIGTNGNGIDLGATVFDTYEQGLYSATLTPSTSGSITLDGSVNAISYTIIGRVAHIQGKVNVTAVSSPVGDYVKLNLPAAIDVPDINEDSGKTVGTVSIIGAAGAMNGYVLIAVEGESYLRIYKGTSSSPVATAPDFSGDEEVYINATYIVA